ncbi:hypothetical protein [Flavobacterium sp. '19STA2R22 D10 B1']|uniref:hypothetical protein n=1 Tax=Flavobacterium aerium TaxID=3037261 RepID=UPI00278BE304|nr:hypothetical protein [Flavobacterium sp. '19STA2R22 D10 B1']
MSIKTKAFLYNFACFAALYMSIYFLIITFTHLQGFWIPVTAAVAATLLAPKFQVVRTNDGDRMFMKWIFIKGIKEIK